jgi:putative DNA primase/helicase
MSLLDQIPDDLKATPRWVGWRVLTREGKPTKPPVNLHTGVIDDPHVPANWVGFDTAVAALADPDYHLDGIGLVLTDADDLVAVDLDHVVDEQGGVADWAWQIVLKLNSYTEISPSGCGLHVWLRGKLPAGGRKKGQIEMYASHRYLTVTGARHPDFPATIENRGAELADLHAAVFGPPAPDIEAELRGEMPATEALITQAMKAKNGTKFRTLWAGDTTGYPSHSEADLALCGLLAFWTGRDAALMDTLFRRSGLMREKWDERHFSGGETYGQHTIATAIAECTEVYTRKMSKAKAKPAAVDPEEEMFQDNLDPDDPANDLEEPMVDEPPPPLAPSPVPPAMERFVPPGFVREYMEAARRRTDAPVESHVLTALTVLSALAGPQPRLPLAHSSRGTRLLIWSMNLVDSTGGRKSVVNDYGGEVIQAVLGEPAILPWKGSPESFIQLLAARDGQTCVLARDEYVGLLLGIKNGGYLAGLAQDFIRMWDGNKIDMGRTKKLNRNTGQRVDDSDVVRNPYLVQMSAATRSRFITVATIDDVTDGFLARFTVSAASAEEERMKRTTPAIEAAWERVIVLAKSFAERSQEVLTVEYPDAILDMEWETEKRYKATARTHGRPDAAQPAMKRLAETVFKVAGLFALDARQEGAACITPGQFEATLRLAEFWQTSALAMIEDIGRTQHQARCDAVVATVAAHAKGIARRDLFRKHRGLKGREFEEVISDLKQQGRLHEVKVQGEDGRPALLYRRGAR